MIRRRSRARTRARTHRRVHALLAVLAGLAIGLAACSGGDDTSGEPDPAPPGVDRVLAVDGDRVVATVDERYQSYNIEMVEVTGGQFWQPYDAGPGKVIRPPIDLASERLRNLARGLGPAYIRVSGTWANRTYFDADGTAGGVPPGGFGGVLTTDQWAGVGEFARAVDGLVVTSFASDVGVRDARGVWLDDQARALLRYSVDHDVPVVAAEFYNEPGFNIGAPAGYDAAQYGRDFKRLKAMVAEVMPDLKLAGPGSADDVTPIVAEPPIRSTDILEAVDGGFDVFSYHFYPKVSARCGSKEGPEIALTGDYLSRVETDQRYYRKVRDRYMPGAPMWVTETAQAACGGDRWAAQYRDVIRYVDTLGRLADGDGDVVFHNTLAASDYGLLDEDGFRPRPDYWAAVLWHRLMGPEVLAVEAPPGAGTGGATSGLGVYAQCTPGAKGGSVTYAVVNSSATEERTVATASDAATVYLLTGESLDGEAIELNGRRLTAAGDGTLPALRGRSARGPVTLPPASVAFVVERAGAEACA